MEMNAVLFAIVGVIGFAFLFAYILRMYNIGPSALEFVHDRELLNHLGELGVIMLMFFIGMEVSLPRLIAKWRVAVLGTAAQMALSVAICCLVAWLLGWSWQSGLHCLKMPMSWKHHLDKMPWVYCEIAIQLIGGIALMALVVWVTPPKLAYSRDVSQKC